MRVGGTSPALFAQRAGWAALAGRSDHDSDRVELLIHLIGAINRQSERKKEMKETKANFWNTPLTRTAITTDDVKLPEMLIGYFIGPFGALLSSGIFTSILQNYFTDVLKLDLTFLTTLQLISTIFIVAARLRARAGTCLLVMANQEREKLGLYNPVVHDTDQAIRIAVEALRKLIREDRRKMENRPEAASDEM